MTPRLGQVESYGRPVSGDGGIISTVGDLATFFRALLGGKLLPPQQLAAMTRTIDAAYGLRFGLGIFRYDFACGVAWGHAATPTTVDVAVARDGSKAVVTAMNNPALDSVRPPKGCLTETLKSSERHATIEKAPFPRLFP
jgi:D-alanyl-D-alanine carboxypeptidase